MNVRIRHRASPSEWKTVTRLREAAGRLNFPAEMLRYAVISGLRGPIRLRVLQQGVKTLDDKIRAAMVAEAAATAAPDAMTVLILSAIKASIKASEKQAAEIKQPAASVATLTAEQASPGEQVDTPISAPVQQQAPPRRAVPCCRHRRICSGRHTHSVRPVEREVTRRLFAATTRHRR